MTENNVVKRRPRLFYLDFIRAIAAVLIVITHFNNPFIVNTPVFFNSPFGIYVGNLGVSLFLIISGAALMYSHGDEPKLALKAFYLKRFKTLYPMFWVAFILANAYYLLLNHGFLPHQAPPWRAVFSIAGLDGLLAASSIRSFYTLGEWFLGFIIIFYVVFPLLRAGVRNHPVITASIILALYLVTILLPMPMQTIPKGIILTTRLPELAFGMYFACYMKHKVSVPVAVTSVVFLLLQQFTSFLNAKGEGLGDDAATTVVGITSFLTLAWLAKYVDFRVVSVPIGTLSKYSYPIFLTHHVIITEIFSHVDGSVLTTTGRYLLFFVTTIIIMGVSIGLDKITDAVRHYVARMFSRPQRLNGTKNSIVKA